MFYKLFCLAALFFVTGENLKLSSFTFRNDVETNTNDIVVLFIPIGCNNEFASIPYKENITFTCDKLIIASDSFSFNGSTDDFPYFTEPNCFVGDYSSPYVNISDC